MAEQVCLHGARRHVRPLAEGAQRDLSPQGGEAGAGRGEAVAPVLPAHGAQEPIDGGGTDPQEGGALLSGERHLVVPLQGLNQVRQKGGQALGAEIVAGFPHLLQCGAQGAQILSGAAGPAAGSFRRVPQQPDRHLAIPIGDPAELIQETTFVTA